MKYVQKSTNETFDIINETFNFILSIGSFSDVTSREDRIEMSISRDRTCTGAILASGQRVQIQKV